jgi:outer membrane protein OmpA-like peptidoglycan-associated protein
MPAELSRGRQGSFACIIVLAATMLVAACAGRSSESLEQARSAVATARADQQVVAQAPEQLSEAEQALELADSAYQSSATQDEVDHLAYVAKQRAGIAEALADEQAALAEIEGMSGQREALLLQARDQHIRVLETELAELQADHTERGLVVTMAEESLFDADQSELKSGGMQRLARVAEFLRDHLDRNLLIEEHTDSSAPYDYNLALSQRRANAIEDFLITQGVEPTRIGAYGYGEQLPIATNETAVGRQANRRVELVILDAGESMSPRPVALR